MISLKDQIQAAFGAVEYPGGWCLIKSREGTEPLLLEKEFKDRDDWRVLDASFIDQAPDGFGTALSFFLMRRSISICRHTPSPTLMVY